MNEGHKMVIYSLFASATFLFIITCLTFFVWRRTLDEEKKMLEVCRHAIDDPLIISLDYFTETDKKFQSICLV
jgi:hypothetical protein